jgi:hypothetical protein
MALVNASLEVAEYTTDFVTSPATYSSIKFKIKQGFEGLAGAGLYAARIGSACSTSGLFAMRHLVATFDSGGANDGRKFAKIKYPVPDRTAATLT